MYKKYLIVGGGIAGLTAAYKISKEFKTNDIMVIEKEERFGGRIYTLPISKDTNIELGAGILHSDNINAIKLVKELGLEHKLFMNNNKPKKTYYKLKFNKDKYDIINKTNIKSYNSEFMNNISYLDEYKKKNKVDNFSLFRVIEKSLGIDMANDMTSMHGYDGDFKSQNANDGIEMLKKDYKNNIMIVKGGMKQIIDKLIEYLIYIGVELYLGVTFCDINKIDNKYNSTIIYNNKKSFINSDNIILAIPKKPLTKIPYLYEYSSLLESVISKALMRVYLIFNSVESLWLKDIDGTITTNTIIRQIIPINKEKGIVMIYVSDENALHLHNLYNNNMLKQEILFNLRRIFNNVPDPIDMHVKFWKNATHVWKPSINSMKESNNILKPIDDERIFIIGEAYAPSYQQWIEGALITVNNLMKII